MAHPLTRAIQEKNKSSLSSQLAVNWKSLNDIKVPFPNEEEHDHMPCFPKIYDWQFVPTEGEHLETPLETAARIGWLDGVKLLLEKGASPRHDERRAFHDPPCALLWACKEGHVDIVKVLLEIGADAECRHETPDFGDTRTPLVVSLNYRHLPIVRVLIDAGIDINKPVFTGNSRQDPPLALALYEGRMEFVKLLIAAGADVSAVRDSRIGFNLYWPGYASQEFVKELLKLWMQAGGEVDIGKIMDHNQDWFEHMGNFGKQAPVPEELQLYRDGRIYQLTLEDKERIVTRQKLMRNANGRSILPAIKNLSLSEEKKRFLAFDCLED